LEETIVLVPRRVTQCLDEPPNSQEEKHLPLESLRKQEAWILLGEPGAGKSKAFEIEAQATEGIFISIAEFLSDEPDPAWREKTLYLDGLDETRASGGDHSVLLRIRAGLKKLGKPRFRIACRAADWFGSTDSQAIGDISQDRQLGVYVLAPLTISDIKEILRENHEIADPETFIENARLRGIEGLLDNPQTLSLLAEAIRDGQWPRTRLETFQLACRKLADEDSKQHRLLARANATPVENILAAAGQLFSVLLLSDKSGVALDRESIDDQFPLLDIFSPSELSIAKLATSRKLFRSATDAQERVVPSHRSIAEFLAAQWLAERIDHGGLPLGRVLNLFLGMEERTVASLRGLYGWLAWHCQSARQRLIEADPLTVIIYGDVKPMSLGDKRRLLVGLRREAKVQIYYRWEIPSANQFGALADKELADDFAAFLGTTRRDDASQSMVACVLDILSAAETIPDLGPMIKAIVLDDAWWPGIRRHALETWLKYSPPVGEAISLLDMLNFKQGLEDKDELIGILLTGLYPEQIPAEKVLIYLHAPKDRNAVGGHYSIFWEYTFPKVVPGTDLPILLDELAGRTDIEFSDEIRFIFDLNRTLGVLITRGLQTNGDNINDERLYAWLGIGADKYGEIRRESEHQQAITDWFAARPERYKGVLRLCYRRSESSDHVRSCLFNQERRLKNIPPPNDIGLWHLEQVALATHDELAEQHFYESVRTLISGQYCADLSLEKIEAWGEANPTRRHWLDSMLTWEIPEWRQKQAARNKTRKLEKAEQKRSKASEILKHLDEIRNGKASPGIMHELAGVWLDHYSDTRGDSVQARFDIYCDNGAQVLEAAETGFIYCSERNDLPSVQEIVDLSTKRHEHYIRKPCLIGMELRWQTGESLVESLSEDKLRRMLAFRLTYGTDKESAWFSYLLKTRPMLVAEVFIAYTSAMLKAKLVGIYGLYDLAYDDAYRAVAELTVIPLLTKFPARIKLPLLPYLEHLLKAALLYAPGELKGLLERKLAMKGMDVPQRVYWLTVGMLIESPQYEIQLWRYIGQSWARAKHLCTFVSDRFNGLSNDYELSAATLGRLIELLTPHADLEHRSGLVTEPMRMGENVHAMVTRLGALANQNAADEIERLLAIPALERLKHALGNAKHQLKLKQRENSFRFPSLQSVVNVLENREPTNAADLSALTLDFLDHIAYEIRHDNDDGFRAFWNVENRKPIGKREENLCRDGLLTRLRHRFTSAPFGVDCQPEGDYANDKRADIRLSYRNNFELPIEIKRDDNRELWGAARAQLMKQYAISPKAGGYGIYLVLWFGLGDFPEPRDGAKKPISLEELHSRLEEQLTPEERQRIVVRVLDVSWP